MYLRDGSAQTSVHAANRLASLVVKASASGAEDPGFESRLRRDFFGPSYTSDLKIGTPVATLPGAWHCRVSAGTGRPGVSILWLGEVESLICNLYLVIQCGFTHTCVSRSVPEISWHVAGTLSNQPKIVLALNLHFHVMMQHVGCLLACLLNVPATCQCISGTDLLWQFYTLPHWDRSCRSNFQSVTAYWHRATQSYSWPYNAGCLAGQSLEC